MARKMNDIMSLGVLIVIIGFIIVFFGSFKNSKGDDASTAKIAVGGFIGQIPFGFGNDKNFVQLVTILSIALFIIWLVFSFWQ